MRGRKKSSIEVSGAETMLNRVKGGGEGEEEERGKRKR
jgi:hypothetical protein